MSKSGYDFYLKKCLLPIAPEKLQVKINNANDTLTLINEGEINILKTPELTDVEFECRIPQVKYPFATYKSGFKGASYFLDYFESLKADKKPFQFIVSRTMPNGKVQVRGKHTKQVRRTNQAIQSHSSMNTSHIGNALCSGFYILPVSLLPDSLYSPSQVRLQGSFCRYGLAVPQSRNPVQERLWLKVSSDSIHHNIFLPALLPNKKHFITDNQPIMNGNFLLADNNIVIMRSKGGIAASP